MTKVATNTTELASQLQDTLNGLPSATPKATQPFDMGDTAQTTKETFNVDVKAEEQIYYLYRKVDNTGLVYVLPVPGASRDEITIDVTDSGRLMIDVHEKQVDPSIELISSRSGCSILSDALHGLNGFDAQLPAETDLDAISSEIKDGLLKITVPLKAVKKKRIEIK